MVLITFLIYFAFALLSYLCFDVFAIFYFSYFSTLVNCFRHNFYFLFSTLDFATSVT